jgi:hypothetical protein
MSASSKPTPIAIPNDLAEKVQIAAELTHLSKQDIMKLAMRIGLEDLRRCNYDIAGAVVDRSDAAKDEIALLADKGSGYRAKKTGTINLRNAAAPLPTYLVQRKGYILEPIKTISPASSEPSREHQLP